MALPIWHTAVSISCCIFCILYVSSAQPAKKKFEYKYSLKGPHMVQKDGSVPFWEFHGSALPSDDQIRITPSLRSKKGSIWTKHKAEFDNWEIEVVFRVTGRGRVGADGLAIWYTLEKPQEGPVYGGPDKWNGVGVFFDSFDNDNQHNNPYVLMMLNDGTKSYDHNSDGLSQQLGGCLRDFRNKPYPVRAKLEYFNGRLTLWVHSGMSNNDQDYEMCGRAGQVNLPKNGYFGVSAATGGLADDHDVLKFLTYSLTSAPSDGMPLAGEDDGHITDDERKKFSQEYDDYYKKLEQQKKAFQEKHPDKARRDLDEENYYEDIDRRELRLIYEGQSGIHTTMRDLHRKLDQVIGREEQLLSAISALQSVGAVAGVVTGGGTGAGAAPSISRDEVTIMLRQLQDVLTSSNHIKQLVVDVQTKIPRGGEAAGRANQADVMGSQLAMHELQDSLKYIRDDISSLSRRPVEPKAACPPPTEYPTCITPSYFLVFMAVQLLAWFGFLYYRSRQEAAAKKFF